MVSPREASLCRQVLINIAGKGQLGASGRIRIRAAKQQDKKMGRSAQLVLGGQAVGAAPSRRVRQEHGACESGIVVPGWSRCPVLVRGGGGAMEGAGRWIGNQDRQNVMERAPRPERASTSAAPSGDEFARILEHASVGYRRARQGRQAVSGGERREG